MNGLEELFEQHPLPWTFDDAHPGFEGRLIVWDANKSIGSIVIDLGDMEDCTMADILLAHAIAALPDLLKAGEAAEAELESQRQARQEQADEEASTHLGMDMRGVYQLSPTPALTSIRTALAKAGASHD